MMGWPGGQTMLESIGNIILMISIIAGGITFVVANVQYKPDDSED